MYNLAFERLNIAKIQCNYVFLKENIESKAGNRITLGPVLKRTFIVLIICFNLNAFSQNGIRIHFKKLGFNSVMEVFPGDVMEFKLRHEHKFKAVKVLELSDTAVYFGYDEFVNWKDIKCIRVSSGNYLNRKFKTFFKRGAILFITLDVLNNLILNHRPILNPKAVAVSASLAVAWLLFKKFDHKKVRLRKSSFFIPVTTNFRDLSR